LCLASFHWRSLEAIKANITTINLKNTFSDMVDYVLPKIVTPSWTKERGELLLLESILAIPCSFQNKLQCGSTFEECISCGYYINSTTNQDLDQSLYRAIPIVSCLHVEKWARSFHTENHLAFLFFRLFQLDTNGTDCYTYEKFHAYWEAIHYYALVKSIDKPESVKLSKLYNDLGQKNKKFVDITVYIYKQMSVSYDYKNFNDLFDSLQLQKNKLKLTKTADRSVLQKFYHLGGTNPGFDSVIFFEGLTLEIVILLISTKYSETNEIKQGIVEINDGYEKSMETINNLKLKNKVYFVVNSWRKNAQHDSVPDNTIVLEKDELTELYASLYQRPQLGSEIVELQFEQSEENSQSKKRKIDLNSKLI
jgi:hypothetical protein